MLKRALTDIPGPKGLPFIGTLLQYIFRKDGLSFDRLHEAFSKRAKDYGPIFSEKLGPQTMVVINDVKEYKKIMQKDGKMPHRLPIEPMRHYQASKGLRNSVVTSNGTEWLRVRTAVNKKLLRIEVISTCAPVMNSVADELIQYLATGVDETGLYKRSLENTFFRWALESVSSAILGTRVCALVGDNKSGQKFVSDVQGSLYTLHKLLYGIPFYKIWPTPTWKQFLRHSDSILQHGSDLLSLTATSPASVVSSGGNVNCQRPQASETLSLFTDVKCNSDLSDSEVIVLFSDLLGAAVDTVTNTVLWCLYELSKPENIDMQDKLCEEARRLEAEGKQVSLDTAARLPYVKACIKETLRLYPPAFITGRIIQEDVTICGYRLPAGTQVNGNVYHMGRDPSLFSDPEKFLPDRWLTEISPDAAVVGQLVWGHGPRMCLGRRLAEQEAYIALSKIMKRFRIQYAGETTPKPTVRLVMAPDIPMKMRFLERK